MQIQKIQRVLRKAVKDYGITASVDEETLIAFIAVDLIREDVAPEPILSPKAKRLKELEGGLPNG